MARSRIIKPRFFTNERMSELPPLTRLLFIGLWCYADRSGRLEDRPKRIKTEILPYDNHNIDTALTSLHDAGFITRYVLEGNKFIQINTFEKHQHCHIKESASTIPAPDKHGASTVQAPDCSIERKNKRIEKEKEEEKEKEGVPKFVLPIWVSTESWVGFEEMRKVKKKPMTVRAAALVVKELDKLMREGSDPNAVLEQSTRNGWTDVYKLNSKGKDGVGGKKSVQEEQFLKNAKSWLNKGGSGDVEPGDDGKEPVRSLEDVQAGE